VQESWDSVALEDNRLSFLIMPSDAIGENQVF
jgi:hypothetical protein